MSEEKQIEEIKELICDVVNFDVKSNNLPFALTNEDKVSVKGREIEEMVKTISTCECNCLNCKVCYSWKLCEALYNAGYRKQSEGEWKYQFTLDGDRFYECSVCGRQVVINCLCNKKRNASEFYPYCHCGAKMKGGAE